MIVFQILMIGIFALKNNASVSTLSIPPLFVTIIFYIFINMYWTRIGSFMELTNFSTLDGDTSVDEIFLKVLHGELFSKIAIGYYYTCPSCDSCRLY